jgi:arylsulfatase
MGRLDNTLIIYIDGDNGTSPERCSAPNQYTSYNGILHPRRRATQVLRRVGSAAFIRTWRSRVVGLDTLFK